MSSIHATEDPPPHYIPADRTIYVQVLCDNVPGAVLSYAVNADVNPLDDEHPLHYVAEYLRSLRPTRCVFFPHCNPNKLDLADSPSRVCYTRAVPYAIVRGKGLQAHRVARWDMMSKSRDCVFYAFPRPGFSGQYVSRIKGNATLNIIHGYGQ